ncbi:MAG TPA: GtrA family protein [Noviherbaspirillum sp.]|jgi:putative flippase GtrA|uniref:GtrA family protein n=1 Tax=Noviherbaspirillum sp. TaxID=1926288 RepID=UPI002DDCB786|nr:GtrA family protein [Noviherbaspirillum sp.]HEV2613026.1 GtrA family protein [Noviherbaspirillum sp.]
MFKHSFFRFLLVGVSNTVIGMGIVYIAWRFFGWQDVSANVLGYLVGFLWSFSMNRIWTFNDKGAVARSFSRFALVCAVAYAANLAILIAARSIMGEGSFLPHIFGAVAYTGLGYVGSRLFAFRQPRHC